MPKNDSSDSFYSRLAGRLQQYDAEEAHIILVYQSAGDDYLLLFQRAALPRETLPQGQAYNIGQWRDALTRDGNLKIISWVAGNTLITLESTLQEGELLQVANGLVLTQTAAETDSVTEEPVDEPPDLSAYPYCDPDEAATSATHSPATPAQAERFGSVRIFFSDNHDHPDHVALGSSLYPGAAPEISPLSEPELLQQAIDALKDPDLVIELRPLPTTMVLQFSPEEECLRRVPLGYEEDYISIEIADEAVTVGFDGDGDRYVDRASSALERELNQHVKLQQGR